MKPVKTETCNAVYTLEGCQDLPVTQYTNVDNDEGGVESCWELTPEEIEQIQKTGRIYLYIHGQNVPPVLLTTESMIFFQKDGDNND